MFDGIFRSNFRTKCKSLLNRIETRLEVIEKRRNAMQRFLKKDIAELLKSNLDSNAYGRAEGLYMELMLSSCYEFVEQCSTCISQNLKEMHKQSECPDKCRVAVASLIYAAARFSDLPELRNLRDLFLNKYGKTIEPFVKSEFVESLKSIPPTTQRKLQLMQEIAREFSVTWDSSILEQQLQTPSLLTQEPSKLASENGEKGGARRLLRNQSTLAPVKGKQVDNNEEESPILKHRRRKSCTDYKENVTNKTHDQNRLQEETIPENNPLKKPFTNRIVPAPYVKLSVQTKDDKNQIKEENNSIESPKPRPKSVRTKFLKPCASTNHGLITSDSSEIEVDPRENLSARATRSKTNDLLSDEDEEEEKFENLATYLGGKSHLGCSRVIKEENETPKFYLPPPPGKRRYLFSDSPPGSPLMGVNSLQRKSSEKSRFLPPDEEKAEMVKTTIRHVRTNSGHQVHPKMPDYDELTERIAALKNS